MASASVARAGAEEGIEWSYNPWREGGVRAALSLAATMTLVALAAWAALPMAMLAALAVAIFALLAPGFIATRCRVDAAGVARRLGFFAWDARSWTAVHSASLTRHGVRIATGKGHRILAPFRTMVLPVPGSPRDTALRAELHARLEAHGD